MTTYKYKGFSSGFSVASDLIWQTCYPVLPSSVSYMWQMCYPVFPQVVDKSWGCNKQVDNDRMHSIANYTHIITFCGDNWNVGVYQLEPSSHTKGLVTRLGCPHGNEPDCFCEWLTMSWSNLSWPDPIPYRGDMAIEQFVAHTKECVPMIAQYWVTYYLMYGKDCRNGNHECSKVMIRLEDCRNWNHKCSKVMIRLEDCRNWNHKCSKVASLTLATWRDCMTN